jgi:type IV pilus assembly protein PilC
MELRSPKLTPEETTLFLDYLKTMVRVNLPLDAGLDRLAKEADSRRLRRLAKELSTHVSAGASLVDSLRLSSARVSPLVIALLEAGERAGNLPEMVDYAARHFRSALRLTNSFRQALIYPKLVLAFIVLAIIPVSLFAAERASVIYRDLESPPRLTRYFLAISSSFVSHPWIVVAIGLVVGVTFLRPMGPMRRLVSWLQVHAPYVGDVYRTTLTASLSRALALLLKSGVPLEAGVEKLALDPDNEIVCRSVDDLARRLKDGSRLSEHLGRYPIFPESCARLVSRGERGENHHDRLLELSDYYEEEAHHKAEMAARIVEPASLLLLALVVGPVVLSVFAPMVQMVANIE